MEGQRGNRPAAAFARRRAILVVPVKFDAAELSNWATGPEPFSGDGVVADAESRAGYFDERIRRALYGVETPCRWHLSTAPAQVRGLEGLEIEAVELTQARVPREDVNGLLAVHGTLPAPDPLGALASLAHLPPLAGPEARDGFESLGDGAVRIDPRTKRVTTLSFFTPAAELQPVLPAGYEDWSAEEQWLWLLASATPFEDYPPDPGLRKEIASSTLRLSRDWSALVLRDGTAFLGRRPDRGADDPFFGSAELYFRSIYLDALLLGMIQRAALVSIADDVAALGDPIRRPGAVHALERRLTEFRNVYWWSHLSGHGSVNDLTAAYGRQHRLPELSRQVVEEVGYYASQVQTAAADRASALLGLLTLVGLPLGAVIGVFQILSIDSAPALAAAVLAAILASVLVVATVARPLIDPIVRAVRRGDAEAR